MSFDIDSVIPKGYELIGYGHVHSEGWYIDSLGDLKIWHGSRSTSRYLLLGDKHPVEGSRFWYIGVSSVYGGGWVDSVYNNLMLKQGNYFLSFEEAKDALEERNKLFLRMKKNV